MKRCFFFDMDGVLFDSMPHHAVAWVRTMGNHGFPFSTSDAYRYEGRTGKSVIDEAFMAKYGRHASEQEWQSIYDEKTRCFHDLGEAAAIPGIHQLLTYLKAQDALIFIVTGSGQKSLLDRLNHEFPNMFSPERMVTGRDVTHGKPDPEPYLMAFEKASAMTGQQLRREDCVVIENAPLGVRSGHEAGFDVFAVNTGPLADRDLAVEGATRIFDNMQQLLAFLQANP